MRSLRRLRPYLHYLRLVRMQIAWAVFFGIIYAAATGIGIPWLTENVFPQIFTASDNRMPWSDVIWIAAYIPANFLVRGLAGYLNSYLMQSAGTRILERLRADYFQKLQYLPLSFVQGRQSGDLLARGLSDTSQLQFTLTQLANDGIKQPFTLLGALGYLAAKALDAHGVTMMLLCLAAVPLAVFPIRYVGKKVLRRAQQVQGKLGVVTALFSENIAAAREVRAYGLEEREIQRLAVVSQQLFKHQLKIVKYAQALSPAIEVIAALGVAGTLLYAYDAQISKDTFLGIITALFLAYEPVKKMGSLNNELKRAEASLDRLEVVLNEPLSIADPVQPVTVDRLRGAIDFDAVSFAYTEGNPVLRDVTVQIPAGTTCALVGPSGAGKSTFANLVPRFFEATEGAVKIDGTDVRAMRLADLRRNIAIVSQEPVLFNDTIYNNLLVGRPDATREEVIDAAKNAFAHDFISAEKDGYDTAVGERGLRLSGGQKQRIALARAFLRNAPILILDEATSALDSESESYIQRALQKLVLGKTVLIIAHRFSTIRDASMILVFENGRVVASGDHATLHADNPLYRSLYDSQASLR